MSQQMTEDDDQDDVNERLDVFEAKLETYKDGLNNAWDTIDDLREELAEEREERQRLEDEVEDLRARTDLLRLVESSDDMTAKQRSVVLIQHLRRAAEKERDRGRRAKASVNRDEAERALQYPDVDRTTIYTDMERAARLVGNQDVLRYVSASGGESRLKMNLEAGDLPSEVAGGRENHEVR